MRQAGPMFATLATWSILQLTAAAAAPTLSLDEALALARVQHPEVRRADAEMQHVLARRVGASVLLPHVPDVMVDVGRRRDSSTSLPASTGLEWTVRLGQMVEVGGQRGARLREVAWAASAARLHVDEARLQAGASTAVAYVRAQAADARVEASRSRAELAQRVHHMVAAKELAGASGGLERTLAEVEHSDARAQLQQALAVQQTTRAALWYSLGLAEAPSRPLPPLEVPQALAAAVGEGADEADHGPPPELCGQDACASPSQLAAAPPTGAPDAQAAADMARQAVRHRPQGQALLATEEGLRAGLVRLGREALPSPTLAFEAQKQQPGQLYFGGGITLPLPLLQRQQGPRAEALAVVRRAQLERQLFAAQCQREASVALRQLQAARAVWHIVHGAQLPAAHNHVEMTVAAWKAGKLDLFRVVQSFNALTEARQRHTDALEALWQAHIERQRVLGELL